jgi:Tfp pilus assembly protein PilF
MADHAPHTLLALKEYAMRYAPAALALSLLVAVTSSMGQGATREPDHRAAVLLEKGRAELRAGQTQAAIDAFEAALAVDPGYVPTLFALADAARADGLQGKAIHFYREALTREPDNLVAISGEGQALFEKGAVEKARRNLTKLEAMCGSSCPETRSLAELIAAGPKTPVLTVEAVAPQPVVTQN